MDKRSNISQKVGKQIANLRKEKGLTQEQLAVKINMDRTFVGYLEKGNRNPSIETANKIAKALGVKLNDIFRFEE